MFKIKKVFFRNGDSTIEGQNYGPYPRHEFKYLRSIKEFSTPGVSYPLLIRSCGMDYWHKNCWRKRTNSDVFAVEYVQKGTFIFRQGGQSIRVNPGEIFLVQQGADNSTHCESETGEKRVIIMCGALLPWLLEHYKLARLNNIIPVDRKKIDAFYDRIDNLASRESLKNYTALSEESYSFLMELARQAVNRDYPQELQNALEYIQCNLDKSLTLQEIASHSNVSSATLFRQFKQHLHVSPIRYFSDRKLERAAELFRQKCYSVKEVAQMLNFSSPQYLATEFRKKYGSSPKKYMIFGPITSM